MSALFQLINENRKRLVSNTPTALFASTCPNRIPNIYTWKYTTEAVKFYLLGSGACEGEVGKTGRKQSFATSGCTTSVVCFIYLSSQSTANYS